jgi:nudix-type nucleoside diphosphatase (YffH/AdpP family)
MYATEMQTIPPTSGEIVRNSIIEVQLAVKGWMSVFIAQVRSATGQIFTRSIEHHGDATAVLPYDPERRVALVISQFRIPVEYSYPGSANVLEAIAGLTETDGPEASARREAMEEAGVRIDELEKVGDCWSMLAVSTERINLFLAPYRRADRIEAGGGLANENEEIDVHEMPLLELAQHLKANAGIDMKLLVLVQALRLRRPDLFGE